ncbi:glycoside hydrolase family protein [Ilumatobacter coccineus]|uniref:beta-fructofuranosidase n=1 Tax=Ilumatobacter coccineus (strain NBRC 103263 / KCTC 29153 / YM16-304) TaxID=1313172 RepID=A0A6C7EA16_ILUCY|nr:glycosidase [Ilumatobacter coccineus]BAN03567.1 putative glycosidase [Ilumatobacter coccineus YM16-304]
MTLKLDDHWIWDFWLVTDGAEHHVFFLKAPKSLGDPDLRHWNASIGHAISTDLHTWTVVQDALGPADVDAWDDKSTWTGSVVRHGDAWLMMYTGTSHAEDGLVQRIGVATSHDLHHWTRRPHPIIEADPEFYEKLSDELWHDEAWRDPWLLPDPATGQMDVFVTARSKRGERFDRGVIGRARLSDDLTDWEVLPPIEMPSGFGQLEVPQLIEIDDRWYLVFCSDVETQSPQRRSDGPGTGTYYLVGDSPFGPFSMIGDGVLEADALGSTYAGRIHRTSDDTVHFMAWNRADEAGAFVGDLTAPRRVAVRADGSLVVSDLVVS